MSVRDRLASPGTTRVLALVAVLALLGASLQVLYHFIDVTGVPRIFLVVVAVTLALATVASRVLKPWHALVIGVVLLAGGLWWYLQQIVGQPPLASLVADAVALLFGRSLLHITGIRAWVLAVSPAPVFVTWYFAMRREYVAAVLVAGGTLGFFVLTTDADAVTTLSGVVAGTVALALGDLERRGEPVVRGETVATVVALMIVVPAVVSVVPAASGVGLDAGLFGDDATLESSLMSEERVGIQGSISLSPEVRYTVESSEEQYWRVASYDRYTGDGWIRTGSPEPTDGSLSSPEGDSRAVTQTIRAERRIQRMPAAWKPTEVREFDGRMEVAADGSIQPARPLEAGEEYEVTSEVPAATPRELQQAGTDYPDGLHEQYTQLPSSTPDRVRERTATLTENADTPYEKARTIERWLENNRAYSLDVPEPRGDVADEFLFEMEEGYCTYYATTMVVMLRSEGVPARFVTGYSSGERVSEDEWVVRGQNSHAWVEVYFPDHGWQRFDPTPSQPRDDARSEELDDARDSGASGVDTSDTRERMNESEWTPTPTPTPPPLTVRPDANDTVGGGDGRGTETPVRPEGIVTDESLLANGTLTPTAAPGNVGGDDDGGGPRLPTRHQLTLVVVAVAGVATGLRRTNAVQRAYRAVWLRYQPRDEPAADVERAFQRLLYSLERETGSERRPDETVREYLDRVDAGDRAREVARVRERSRHRGTVTESDADEAVRLVDDLVR